jgi:predicted  nucleic acid-binding Zn-ribbon protein
LSEEVEQLKAENETLSLRCSELETELATVKTERDDYAATVDEFIKDYKRWQQKALTPEKRDRILNALGVGKQAPLYKRIKVVLDQFVNEA